MMIKISDIQGYSAKLLHAIYAIHIHFLEASFIFDSENSGMRESSF